MQQDQSITADPLPSHLTTSEVQKMARDAGAQIYDLGGRVLIQRGSFRQTFDATGDALFRAAPIRSWLGV